MGYSIHAWFNEFLTNGFRALVITACFGLVCAALIIVVGLYSLFNFITG